MRLRENFEWKRNEANAAWPRFSQGMWPDMKPLDALRADPFFSLFTEAELCRLAKRSVKREFAKGGTIFNKGRASNGLYVILTGSLALVLEGARPYWVLGPGQKVGLVELLDGKPQVNTVIAMEPSTLLFIARREFEPLFAARPELAVGAVAYLCERLRWIQNTFAARLSLNFPAQLASLVLYLYQHFALPDDKVKQPSLRFSQREIAALLGISREWVGQELIKWREADYIELRRSRLIVRNKPALERIIASGDSRTSNS
jgi:CRP-like cAMP-binding protein